MNDNTTTPVVLGLVIIISACIVATVLLGLPIDEDRIGPGDSAPTTMPPTVPVGILPPPLTTAADVTAGAMRGPVIQLTEPPPAPTTTVPVPPHYSTWIALADCESGGDWGINSGNGFYGGLQFTLSSWQTADGGRYAFYPHHATALQQMWTAERVLTMRAAWGMNPWAAWPGCSRQLGLR